MKVYVNGYVIDGDTVLEYAANPKRIGFKAHARYEQYQEATTLDQYMSICADWPAAKPDLKYDESKGYLKLIVDGVVINDKD